MKTSLKIVSLIAGLWSLLLLAACPNHFLHQPAALSTLQGSESMSNVIISIGDGNNARTLFPQAPVFSRYELRFEPLSGQTAPAPETFSGSDSVVISLTFGDWSITAIGYVITDDTEEEAAWGSGGLTVLPGVNNLLSIDIYTVMEEGTGVFSYDLLFPADTDAALLKVLTLGAEEIANVDLSAEGASGSFPLDAGYYLLRIELEKGQGKVVKTEVIHIYHNLTTSAHGAEYTFSDDDFLYYYTVTFDADNSSPVTTQIVIQGGTAAEPGTPTKTAPAGLYAGAPQNIEDAAFMGWYNDGAAWNFTAGIMGNITIKAKWTESTTTPVNLSGQAGDNIAAKAVAYVNNYPQEYTLIVDRDTDCGPQTINAPGAKLTIIGMGTEHKINLSSNGTLFMVQSGATLVLDNNITLQGCGDNLYSLVWVDSGGTLLMNSGSKITGNRSYSIYALGGGVCVDGIFTMNGGEISGNTNSGSFYNNAYGGGVYVRGTFTMNGGEITGNTAPGGLLTGNGGGVYVDTNASFTIEGGKISNNTATGGWSGGYGGAIYVNTNASFTMSNGEISGNYASHGGGMYVNDGTFTMNGGHFIRNSPDNIAGDGTFYYPSYPDTTAVSADDIADFGSGARVVIFTVTNTDEWDSAVNAIEFGNQENYIVDVQADLSVTGITGNTFSNRNGIKVSIRGTHTISLSDAGSLLRIGANQTVILRDLSLIGKVNKASLVCVFGTFTMNSGEISGNTALFGNGSLLTSGTGGGVYISSGTFTMNGGEISGNTASSGGGVYISSGIFTINGGKISGNTANANGGLDISGNTVTSYGGGVYVANSASAIFRIAGGTIYGSDEVNEKLRNTAENGAALYKEASGVTECGTFSGDTWVSSGNLGTSDNTIKVVNGALQ